MKNFLPLTVLCVLLGTATSLFAQTGAPKTDREKVGYAIGLDVARTLKKQGIDFDPAQFAAAVRDVYAGGKLQLSDEEMQASLMALNNEMRARQQAAGATADAQGASAAAKNKKDGDDFLAANKSKPGVQTLPDGMQYKVIKEGKGASPKATDTVTVKYRGTLINGTEFDNSEKHGGTASFPVNGVIPGWTEALQKMKTGAAWQLFIPANLAYGDRGAGGEIGPGSTLIFDVELVSIGQ